MRDSFRTRLKRLERARGLILGPTISHGRLPRHQLDKLYRGVLTGDWTGTCRLLNPQCLDDFDCDYAQEGIKKWYAGREATSEEFRAAMADLLPPERFAEWEAAFSGDNEPSKLDAGSPSDERGSPRPGSPLEAMQTETGSTSAAEEQPSPNTLC